MSPLPFTKMHGAGNDFVLVDDWPAAFTPAPAAIAAICSRRRGVGADGFILLRPPSTPDAHVRMLFYNSDGSRAAMCGNGGRCLARFAVETGHAPDVLRVETDAGILDAALLAPSLVRLQLPPPRPTVPPLSLDTPAGPLTFHSLDTGVPHAVAFLPPSATPADLDALPLPALGPLVRRHPHYAPAGTNVDFALPDPASSALRLRTYERGVEAETEACGTGAVAAALLAASLRLLPPGPVTVHTAGGTLLTVDPSPTAPHLTGPAEISFRGTWPL